MAAPNATSVSRERTSARPLIPLVGEVRDEAGQVEGDFAVLGRDSFPVVFQHGQQLFVCGPVGVSPEALRGGGLEDLVGALARDLAQAARHWACQLLGFAGQDVFQFLFDVDVGVELVDEIVADGGADRRVLDQPVAGVDPVVGVQRLALDPDGEHAEEGEQRAQHDQCLHRPPAPAAHLGLPRVAHGDGKWRWTPVRSALIERMLYVKR
jgi:hypothetical protein